MRRTKTNKTAVLSIVFFFSGFAGLIYQVIWQRLLTLHYGLGSVSTTLIVSVFLSGLGIGALVGGHLAERIKKRLTLYFFVEAGIGFFGLISLPFLHLIGRYTAGIDHRSALLYMALFLFTPTFLMGVTLPLLMKIFNSVVTNFVYSVSFLYFINTLGAALGSLFASYVLISLYGLDTGIYFAAAINLILALLIICAKRFGLDSPEASPCLAKSLSSRNSFSAYALIFVFITGFVSIGYEIVWFRIITLLVKGSPYAFSSILSIFLFGIALGSYTMSVYLRRRNAPIDMQNLFFLLQFLIGLYVILNVTGYYYLLQTPKFSSFIKHAFLRDLHPIFLLPSMKSLHHFLNDLFVIFDVFLWPIFFLFVPTFLMGASFPVVSALANRDDRHEARTIGNVYFVNILGNVSGALATGFGLLAFFGTERTLLIFSVTNIAFAFLLGGVYGMGRGFWKRLALIASLIIFAVLFFPARGELYQAIHFPPEKGFENHALYLKEGVDGVIATYRNGERVENYINGLGGHGNRPGYGYMYETLEAVKYCPKVENVLIIGFGTGTITETIIKLHEVKKVSLVELNKTLMANLKNLDICERILEDDRVRLILDDGRRYLLRTDETFDLILMDPTRSTTSHSNNLYSLEFYEIASRHLKPEGVLMLRIHETRIMPKTLFQVFGYGRMYSHFCLASNRPLNAHANREQALLAKFSEDVRERILQQAGIWKYLGDRTYVERTTNDFPVNRDWKPWCEYYLGLKMKGKYYSNR